jgi:hypothetical protein
MTTVHLLLILRLLAALALYAFLAGVLFILWKDLKASTSLEARPPRAYLCSTSGESDPAGYRLEEVNLLGRSPSNSVAIEDETVSTQHARLSFQAGQWWIEDLGSRNGTRLNGLEVTAPLVVTYGDHIQIGAVTLELRADPPDGSAVPSASTEPGV